MLERTAVQTGAGALTDRELIAVMWEILEKGMGEEFLRDAILVAKGNRPSTDMTRKALEMLGSFPAEKKGAWPVRATVERLAPMVKEMGTKHGHIGHSWGEGRQAGGRRLAGLNERAKSGGGVLRQRAGFSRDEIERNYRPDQEQPINAVSDAVGKALAQYKSASRTPDYDEASLEGNQTEKYPEGWSDGYDFAVAEMEKLARQVSQLSYPTADWRVFRVVAQVIDRIRGEADRLAEKEEGKSVFSLELANAPDDVQGYYKGFEAAAHHATWDLVRKVIEDVFSSEMDF